MGDGEWEKIVDVEGGENEREKEKKMKISLNHLFTVVYILSPKNVASFMKNAPKPL